MTGFEIKTFISENMEYFWNESYGQLYPSLKYLCENGYISVTKEKDKKLEKKIYSVNSKGEKLLIEWLKTPSVQLPQSRNELLLKLYHSSATDSSVPIDHIEKYRQKIIELQKKLDQKNNVLKKLQMQDKKYVYWRIAVLNGLSFCEAELKWSIISISLLKNIYR